MVIELFEVLCSNKLKSVPKYSSQFIVFILLDIKTLLYFAEKYNNITATVNTKIQYLVLIMYQVYLLKPSRRGTLLMEAVIYDRFDFRHFSYSIFIATCYSHCINVNGKH